jgi:hypothetical protein
MWKSYIYRYRNMYDLIATLQSYLGLMFSLFLSLIKDRPIT